jgi:signal transduction histidine kinase/ActR/RegA family two-component response regulator
MHAKRYKLLGLLLVLAATIGLMIAIFALEAQANSSRAAEIRIEALTQTLADLETAPYTANATDGGSPKASLAEINADEATMLRALTHAAQPYVSQSLLVNGRIDVYILEPDFSSLYLFFAQSESHTYPRIVDLEGVVEYRSALEQVFHQIAHVDAARAANAQAKADFAIGAGMALLLSAFAFFYLRASRLGEVAKRTAEMNAIARDEAVEASNAKSIFIATVSHELRTPLSSVIGMSELLLDTPLEPQQLEYAQRARSASEGLLLVINDILDFSKIEAGKLELDPAPFSLRETVNEACAMLHVLAREKRVELTVDIDNGLPAWLHGDGARIRQVVLNLLSNAVKFTDRGQVSVSIKAEPFPDASHIRVEVADTGIGIDETALKRLFQPFVQAEHTTARTYGGTGLGLAISAQLIGIMDGTIGATSEPGKGSMFWFELSLPLAESEQPDVLLSEADVPRAPVLGSESPPIVLVAEDNPTNQIIAARTLERIGYAAEIVSDGHEALAAVRQATYAAVLMDCQMPGMNGYEATREIRRAENGADHLPIIAMTASTMPGDRENCMAAGMDDYVSKPIRVNQLAEVLARTIIVPQRLVTLK